METMEATLKRKMWKVAIAHLVLSVVIGLLPFIPFVSGFLGYESFYMIWTLLILLLQPLVVLSAAWVGFWFVLPLMPIWSLCFGWISVKLLGWLNHFPVLGRKVF